MSDNSTIHLQRLHGRLSELACEMTKMQFSHLSQGGAWSPALNIYHCEHSIVVCADLAGVDRTAIDLNVEPKRLLIRGTRVVPEPNEKACRAVQMLAMEIDSGPFEREVLFPDELDVERVTAEQKNGLLWIYLPLRAAG